MNTLPEEVVSHIFSLEAHDSATANYSKGDDWDSPISSQVRTRTLTLSEPSPPRCLRQRKRFTGTVSSVCSSWRDISNLKSNSHLWITNLLLVVPVADDFHDEEFDSSPFILTSFTMFKQGLDNANGSDLDVTLRFHATL